jgi:hypothetical protein
MKPKTKTKKVPNLVFLLALASAVVEASPSPEFLVALAKTESNGDPNARGKSGDLGLYQMTGPAWEDVNRARRASGLETYPHSFALVPTVATIYAETHLRALSERLNREGYEPDAGKVWLAWNLGFSGARRIGFNPERAPASTRRGLARLEKHLDGKGFSR